MTCHGVRITTEIGNFNLLFFSSPEETEETQERPEDG
jgi:hypothetical protein